MLERLARLMYRRRRRVVATWLLAVVALSAAASSWAGEHRADYAVPGSDSARAQALLTERFPDESGDAVQLVVQSDAGVATPAASQLIEEVSDEVAAVEHVSGVEQTAVSPDGTVALLTVQLDETAEKIPVSTSEAILEITGAATTDAIVVEAGGTAIQNAEGAEAGSEGIGMVAALLILLVAFGSVLAAGLPILIALFGVGAALAAAQLLNHVLVVPDWAPSLVSMIGLGVGIDYALFIITRYRSALATGEAPEDAVVTALTTAGRAVVFAGGTVVVSLLGLVAMGMEYLYGTAAATVTGVLLVLVASMTLLPALLGFAGRSIDRLRIPGVRGGTDGQGLWGRWSRIVQSKPIFTGAVALAILIGLAAPVTGLRFGYPDAGTGGDDLSSRRAYDLVETAFGPGANGPVLFAVELGDDAQVLDRLASGLAAEPGVAGVLPPQVNEAGDTAVVVAFPTTGPQDPATEELLGRLRDQVVPTAVAGGGADIAVGGATAAFVDESDYMGGRLPWFIGSVIALSFLLLLTVFRSLLVALKAAAMNVLAIGAAYGVMASALDGGWLGDLLGIPEATPVPVWLPMMMFALLFGLSMDYEVFLLSRIREEYLQTGDNAGAVAHGIARTGRVISAAAAIMVTVFGAFMLGDQVIMKVAGLGLATAVFVDATIVRMVLVPSTMELLGDRNWWMPRWLDRLLPRIDVEGGSPAERELAAEPMAA